MTILSAAWCRPSACALAVLALASGPSGAATSTGTMQVSATVVSACTVSGSTLNFGSAIDPIAAVMPLDTSAAITVQCTSSTPYTVALDAGINAGGATGFANRAMRNGASTLPYQLYLDASRTMVWGNGTVSSVLNGVGTGIGQALTIYGRLPALSGAVPGAYSDVVTITITY